MRIISDELYARLVTELAKNEAVAVFQQLLLSPKKDGSDGGDGQADVGENGNGGDA